MESSAQTGIELDESSGVPDLAALKIEEDKLEEERKQRREAFDSERRRLEEIYEADERRISLHICAIRLQQNELVLISRLPDELLSMIFVSALASQHRASMRLNRSPLNTSQVCSRWRRVSLSTPRLWSQLYIGMRYGRAGYGLRESTLAWLEARISRIKAAPLTIGLHTGESLVDEPLYLQGAIKLVSPQYVRCRSLSILLRNPRHFDAAIGPGVADMPALAHLAISHDTNGSGLNPLGVYHIPFRIRTRCLESIYLLNVTLQLPVDSTVLSQISSLRLIHGSILEALPPVHAGAESNDILLPSISDAPRMLHQPLQVFSHAAKLRELCIGSLIIPTSTNVVKVQLPIMRSLELILREWRTESLASAIALLQGIEIPVLRSLTIHGDGTPRVDNILAALRNTVPSIETFTLNSATFQGPVMLNFLSSVPALRRLDLAHTTISSPFLNGLKAKKGGTICPCLEELDISRRLPKSGADGYRPYDVDSLYKMIKSRCAAVDGRPAKFRKLIVKGSAPSTESTVWESLEACVPSLIRSDHSRQPTGDVFYCRTDDEDDENNDHHHYDAD